MPDWRTYVRTRLPRLACAPEREAEIVEEVAQQLQDIYDGAIRIGASTDEAEARVHAEIQDWSALAKDLQQAQDPVLARPRTMMMERVEPTVTRFRAGPALLDLWRDVRHACRALASQPLFTLTTLLTFAFGIGATTVVFSLVHSVLLSPLPYHDPDRLAAVRQVIPEIADRMPILGVNPRSFISWQASCRTACAGMAAFVRSRSTLTGLGEPEGLVGARISPSFFDVLGTVPLFGRSFHESEAVPGRDRVVIITHGSWQRRFGGDPSVVGRVIVLDGVPVEIVGILRGRIPRAGFLAGVPVESPPPDRVLPAVGLVRRHAPLLGRVRQSGHSPACG